MNPPPTPEAIDGLPETIDGWMGQTPGPPWWWIGVGVGLVVLLVGWWIWWKRRQPREPSLTARDAARAALQRLRAQLATVEPYPFSIEISNVLRQFFAQQYGVMAPRKTSREFLDELHRRATLPETQENLLSQFLDGCDLIKFASVPATAADSERLFAQALKLVEETRG